MTSPYKDRAIQLRKEGNSYSEILRAIPVAKSTLSLWLRDVGLAVAQKQKLTAKKLAAGKRGGDARKMMREKRVGIINAEASRNVGRLTKREIWLVGAALYWAEGTKEKEHRHGSGIAFTNSDPQMANFFLLWLREICMINEERIYFEIYLHETSALRVSEVVRYWSKQMTVSEKQLNKIYFKKSKIVTNRKNIGVAYFGTVKIKVRKSSDLVRYISGWSDGIAHGFDSKGK